MLPTPIVLEIRRLLDNGELSLRKIAARLHVSRGTVGAIARGRRGLHGKEPPPQPTPREPELVPARCRHCGGMVYAPCRLCVVRAYRQRAERLRRLAPRPRAGPRRVA